MDQFLGWVMTGIAITSIIWALVNIAKEEISERKGGNNGTGEGSDSGSSGTSSRSSFS